MAAIPLSKDNNLLSSSNNTAESDGYKSFPTEYDVSISKEWIITFNDLLSEDSITSDSIKVVDRNGEKVPLCTPEILADGKTVKVKPVGRYAYNTKYTLIIDGVKSHNQKNLSKPVKKDFYTEAELIVIGQETKSIDNPNVNNVIKYQNKAAVEIAANTVSGGTEVTIKEMSGAKNHEYHDLKTLGTYDISIGSTRTFANDLTLRFKYDPAMLKADYNVADQLVVAYLDEEHNRWVEVDFSLDENSQEVVVLTDHLSLWSIFGIDEELY